MTALAPTLQAFFTDCLPAQHGASPHTIAAYRDTWRLLLRYATATTGTPAHATDLAQLDADLIGGFLNHLETDRGNAITTRNARLAAVHSFFAYAALRHPEHAAGIARVLAMPAKRHPGRTEITYLTVAEADALLDAPDQSTPTGRRDRVLIQVAMTTGLRVSELTGLHVRDLELGTAPRLRAHGKGRKDRTTPLDRNTAAALRAHSRGLSPEALVFTTRDRNQLSRDAIAARLTIHAATAAHTCPTLTGKRVTPHVLRHTAAMRLLEAGVDTAVIALWLGHESTETTQMYLHADLAMKERALARTTPTTGPTGRYRPDDALLAFLQSL